MTGRVAVLRDYGRPVELEEFEVPEPEPGGMILKIEQATICGSDLHVWRGETAEKGVSPAGLGFGHEGFGVVHALGEGTTCDNAGKPLREGDRVVHHTSVPSIGRVPRARAREYGEFPYFFTTFADYYYVSADRAVYKVPDELADDALPSLNCAMGTSINSVIAAGTTFGSNVVVFGAGALGLTAAAAAKDMGASTVIVLDRVPTRLQLAVEFGADHTINVDEVSSSADRVALVRELTNGRGADVALELVGLAALLPEGVEMLAPGGTFAEVGLFYPGTTVAFDPSLLHGQRKRIVGLSRYSDELIPKILDFLVRNRQTRPFERMVSHKYPLAEINEALAMADWSQQQRDVSRVALIP
jgi:threonine dehydrogenase-like Zn-dependent dehydrogenase